MTGNIADDIEDARIGVALAAAAFVEVAPVASRQEAWLRDRCATIDVQLFRRSARRVMVAMRVLGSIDPSSAKRAMFLAAEAGNLDGMIFVSRA